MLVYLLELGGAQYTNTNDWGIGEETDFFITISRGKLSVVHFFDAVNAFWNEWTLSVWAGLV